MNEIRQKQSRDWLGAWTILVLPGLAWAVLSFIVYHEGADMISEMETVFYGTPNDGLLDFFSVLLIVIMPLCLAWAAAHYVFVRRPNKRSKNTRYIQIAISVILSVAYISLFTLTTVHHARKCGPYDSLNPDKPWCHLMY